MRKLLLASGSPRRASLLAAAGVDCEIFSWECEEEQAVVGEDPAGYALRAAEGKLEAALNAAAAVAGNQGAIAICADTVVASGGEIFGKPADSADARRMLVALSGRAHQVHTGVAIGEVGGARRATFVETTEVRFLPLSLETIEAYIETGEPMDKAGAYGIQERAAAFVAGVSGCYANVVGLPVSGVMRRLEEIFDIRSEEFWRKP
ncbi:MAG: Maf family protein [bacterium]